MTGLTHPRERSVEECLHWWRAVIGAARDDWAKAFALSVSKQSRRPGWAPSPKQLGIMRRMVGELFAGGAEDEIDLIEGSDV